MIMLESLCLAILLCCINIQAEELEPYCNNVSDAFFYRHSCFIFEKQWFPYHTGKGMCEQEHHGFDSHLAFIQSDDVMEKLAEHAPSEVFYIGLLPQDVTQQAGQWVWQSGSNKWPATNFNWPQGEPLMSPNLAGYVRLSSREMRTRPAQLTGPSICQIEDPGNRVYRRSKNIRFESPFLSIQVNDVKECANKCKTEMGCVGFSLKTSDYGMYCMMASYSTDKKDMMKRDYSCDSYDRV